MSEFLRQPSADFHQETAAERHAALSEMARQSMVSPDEKKLSEKAISATPHSELLPSSGGSKSARELQAQIRRNRQKRNMQATLIVTGVAVLFLGGAGWMYWSKLQANRMQMAKVDDNAMEAKPQDPSGITTDSSTIAETVPSKKRMNLGATGEVRTGRIGALPKIGDSTAVIEDQPETPSPKPNEKPAVVATPAMPAIPSMDKQAAPAEEPAIGTSAAEMKATQKKWSEAMNASRNAIVARDFENFHKQISLATELSNEGVQGDQCQRLDTFGQLFEQSQDFVKEAIANLKATESVAIGKSSQVSIVEVKENEIILRGTKATNETYPFDKLPIGFVESILNLRLIDTPMHDAVRGTFFLLDPRSTAVTKKRAQGYFDKAAQADPKFEGLGQVMDEKY